MHFPQEWYRFEREALNDLRQLNDPPLIQVLIWPTFERPEAWNIEVNRARHGESRYVYSFVTWHRHDDLAIIGDPSERLRFINRLINPHLTRRTIDRAPDAEVDDLLRRLASLTPPLPSLSGEGTKYLDGVRCEVAISLPTVSARYAWTNQVPYGWAPLAAFAEEVRTLIRAAGSTLGWFATSQPN